jgi:hypothetical protein
MQELKKPTIIETVRLNRLRWFGHIQRTEENKISKRVLYMNLGTTRLRRRPKKEEVERVLQVLGVRRWRELVADSKNWKDIVRQAKAHSGL